MAPRARNDHYLKWQFQHVQTTFDPDEKFQMQMLQVMSKGDDDWIVCRVTEEIKYLEQAIPHS